MSRRNTIKPIDEAMAYLWKKDTVDYLKTMQQLPEPMVADLMKMLRPHYKFSGHLLLEPDMYHTDALYMRVGMAKLYLLDAKSGKQQIIHIWVAGEIILLHRMFIKRLQNTKFYIEMIEDAELVSISNDCMDRIYKDYPAADKLTVDILDEKHEKRLKHQEILSIEYKGDRYGRFVVLFPELVNRLGNEDMCAFLGVSEPTLLRAKYEYLGG